MTSKPPSDTSPDRDRRPLVDPPAGPPGAPPDQVGETPLETRRSAERAETPDPADPADARRGMPELQSSRLSPPVLVLLVALALGLFVLLVVFGGFL